MTSDSQPAVAEAHISAALATILVCTRPWFVRGMTSTLHHPNSPGNASQRGGSQHGSRAAGRREDPKENKAMPLTAGAALNWGERFRGQF